MTIFNGQDKNKLIEYFFESIKQYKVKAQPVSSNNTVVLTVGGNNITINNNRRELINERNVLIR